MWSSPYALVWHAVRQHWVRFSLGSASQWIIRQHDHKLGFGPWILISALPLPPVFKFADVLKCRRPHFGVHTSIVTLFDQWEKGSTAENLQISRSLGRSAPHSLLKPGFSFHFCSQFGAFEFIYFVCKRFYLIISTENFSFTVTLSSRNNQIT